MATPNSWQYSFSFLVSTSFSFAFKGMFRLRLGGARQEALQLHEADVGHSHLRAPEGPAGGSVAEP